MKTRETEYSASCRLDLGKGYSSLLRYQYTNFDDELDNPLWPGAANKSIKLQILAPSTGAVEIPLVGTNYYY